MFETTVGMANKMENFFKKIVSYKNPSSWSSPKATFLVQGFEVAQEIWPSKNSP